MRELPKKGTTTALAAVFLTTLPLVAAASPAAAAERPYSEQCTFPNGKYPGRPWALQRVMLDELWTQSKGKGVKVAVIDTGVDVKNPQLTGAVDAKAGKTFKPDAKGDDGKPLDWGNATGTTDTVGHGTKVAGIIAARPAEGTGFVGLAPEATIIPLKQNDAEGHGTPDTLADAIVYAVRQGAGVINISQDTTGARKPSDRLEQAVDNALAKGTVIVASAGNDGTGGNVKKTYPASYDGVLAVAASDRNNERAAFSQSGDFVGVAAPGVDMISTVPGGGHCSDNGTSFSAPYVAGVAALIKAKHPQWTAREVVAQIEALGRKAVALRLEVGDASTFARFSQAVGAVLKDVWGRETFDHLVNNAGHGEMAAFAETTVAQFDALIDVHVKGVFFLSQALLPLLADGGRIVNLSTGLTRVTYPGFSAYATAKGAVEVLSVCMARELGGRGITVNTVAPGAIETDFLGGAVRDMPELNQQFAGMTALGRVGVPDDIGPMIASLLGADNRWVTGQRIEVSGGQAL